jgi:glycosyltransferase involved in cell wall biosynthesis
MARNRGSRAAGQRRLAQAALLGTRRRGLRQFIRAHAAAPDYDVMLIGYPGQFDAYLGRRLAHGRGRPVALDILMSLHLVAEERGLTPPTPTGRLLFRLERGGLRRPDLLIAENPEYGGYIAEKYDLPRERFRYVPHGADETVFHPRPLRPPDDHFRVTYHGGYLPSHGMDAILGAAALLRDRRRAASTSTAAGRRRRASSAARPNWACRTSHFHGFVSQDELLDGLATGPRLPGCLRHHAPGPIHRAEQGLGGAGDGPAGHQRVTRPPSAPRWPTGRRSI